MKYARLDNGLNPSVKDKNQKEKSAN